MKRLRKIKQPGEVRVFSLARGSAGLFFSLSATLGILWGKPVLFINQRIISKRQGSIP